MRKISFLLLVLLAVTNQFVYCQDWCHQGSQWTYYTGNVLGEFEGYKQYHYEKDTIIQSQFCKKLSAISVIKYSFPTQIDTGYPSPLFTFSKNDTVFFYNAIRSTFDATYFFSANFGDTVNYFNPFGWCDSLLKLLVQEKGTITISGHNLRYYLARVVNFNNNIGYPDTIRMIERIGSSQDMRPQWEACATDVEADIFRRYKDDSFSVYQPYPIACDYITEIETETTLERITISPNPLHSLLFINSTTELDFEIINIYGERIAWSKVVANQPIEISNLPRGIYFLRVRKSITFLESYQTIKFVKD